MIPPPPLNNAGRLAVNRQDVATNLVGGLLLACCVCGHGTPFHWRHQARYVPLHRHCVPRLLEEWRTLIAHDEVAVTAPAGRPLGAYARRRAPAGARIVPVAATSVDQGSPYFVPGMPEGAPWVAVARMPNDTSLIVPCGESEMDARRSNALRRAATARGFTVGHAGRLGSAPLAGWVVDPTGEISDRWEACELNSRDNTANIAR